ncbi:MAG: hypothetical protein ACO34D_10230, partial [Burkholderiaceae bacterium]
MNTATQATTTDLRKVMANPSGPIEGGGTRWTLGAIYQRRAREANLEAIAGIRQDTPRAAGRYLMPQIAGTNPRTKAIDIKAAKIANLPTGTV